MKKLFAILTITMLSLSIASAQDYKWAVGARFGGEMGGATVKYNLDGVNALEGMLA